MVDGARGPTLVFGGSGFLGAHVVLAAGSGVVFASRDRGVRPHPPHAGFRRMDALAPGELENILDDVRPARVIVCTALSDVGLAESYPALARALNIEFPSRIAAWCREQAARLVHVSTDLVFGAREPGPGGFREEEPPEPVSEYGRSKAMGERAVLETYPAALVVRLPLLYGHSFGRARGASDSLFAAVARGETPRLFADEWRTPLEVGTAARALVELVEGDEAGILHVAGPERVSRYELALAVVHARGLSEAEARARIRSSTRAEAGMAATRPRDVSLDASRARRILSTVLLGPREDLARAGLTHLA